MNNFCSTHFWRLKNRYFILLALLACGPCRNGIAQELPLTHFTTEKEINPLPSAAITAVYQDHQGYVWLAPYSAGLIRYDGSKMELYNSKNKNLTSTFSITQDQKNRLWIGTANFGIKTSELPLDHYAPGDSIKFVDTLHNIALHNSPIHVQSRLITDANGNIWTSSKGIILKYHYINDSLKVDSINQFVSELNENVFISMTTKKDGTILAMAKDNLLIKINPTTNAISVDTIIFENSSKSTIGRLNNIYYFDNNTLWGINVDGTIWSWNMETDKKANIRPNLSNLGARSLHRTSTESILVTTVSNGLLEFNDTNPDSEVKKYTAKNGLISNVLWDLIQDREGNIWIASNNGLSRMQGDYKAFGHYTANSVEGHPNMLPEAGVNGINANIKWFNPKTKSIENLVAACTSSGVSLINHLGNREILTTQQGLASNTTVYVLQDSKLRIWILGATSITCLSQSPNDLNINGLINKKKVQLWNTPFYIAQLPIQQLSVFGKRILLPTDENDPRLKETLWFTTPFETYILVQNKWLRLGSDAGLPGKALISIATDKQNTAYIADELSGVFKSQKKLTINQLLDWYDAAERTKSFYRNASTPVMEKHILTKASDTINGARSIISIGENLWMTSENGLVKAKYGENQYELMYHNEKVNLKGLVPSNDSTKIWISSNHGVFLYDIKSKKITHKANKTNGLISDVAWGYPGIDVDNHGILYFATNKGLSLYNSKLDLPDNEDPKVVFRDIQYNENNNGSNELSIEFAGLTYIDEKNIKYKTRLKEYDNDWSEESSENSIRYTNLPAYFTHKEYTFEVMAGDSEGNWNTSPEQYTFYVSPPWYLHWFSVMLYILALAILIQSYIRWRTRELEKRQQVLEAKVEERTAELKEEKEVSENLLLNILPSETAKELKEYGKVKGKLYDTVTIIFTDFKGFTKYAEDMEPDVLIDEIHHCYEAFDRITEKHNIEKIKTIGDAYMAAAGLPTRNQTHASDAARAALEMRDFIDNFRKERSQQNKKSFDIRVGLHSGPVVAGIVGIKKFAYDIWGDTVNLAAGMESSGQAGKVNISSFTYDLLKNNTEFTFESRGKIKPKNKAPIDMYFVEKQS